jgi:hypothetical protein
VAGSLWKLADLPGTGIRWSEVAAQLEEMKAKGVLSPSDEKHLELARQNAAKEKAP